MRGGQLNCSKFSVYFVGNGDEIIEDEMDPDLFAEFTDGTESENGRNLMRALGDTPLSKNQFFIRTMSDGKFNGNGTEGLEPGFWKIDTIFDCAPIPFIIPI